MVVLKPFYIKRGDSEFTSQESLVLGVPDHQMLHPAGRRSISNTPQ